MPGFLVDGFGRLAAIGDDLADLAVVALISALTGFVVFSLLSLSGRDRHFTLARFGAAAGPVLALAVLGAAAGLAGGMSRTGVVGEIVPAAFTLLGGVAAFLFGMDSERGANVALATIVFATALFGGFHRGAWKRNFSEEHRELRAFCLKAMTDNQFVANEKAFDRFWNAMSIGIEGTAAELGLPIDAPAEARFRKTAHLCGSIVVQWRLRPDVYHWNEPEALLPPAAAGP